MIMFDTKIKCPVCERPLTDVDGMLECQNPDATSWHFIYYDEALREFNFNEWAKYHVGSDK